MKLKWILLGLVFLFCIEASFAAKKKKVVRKKNNTTVKATQKSPGTPAFRYTQLPLCKNTYQFPAWNLAIVKDFVFPSGVKAPANYRLACINEAKLNDYLSYVPYDFEKAEKKMIQIPLYINGSLICRDYRIVRVQTMDTALQAKYPKLMSFKAYDPANPLNTARIECDENFTKMSVSEEGQTYFVQPYRFRNITFYACYGKNDPNFKKEDFEVSN
ncbi:MAG: hypothetical protein JNM95_14565 [Chitinophagaceae bacterium]|nr:hypothetical protein [Chitinophagaceae bacterium]